MSLASSAKSYSSKYAEPQKKSKYFCVNIYHLSIRVTLNKLIGVIRIIILIIIYFGIALLLIEQTKLINIWNSEQTIQT